MTELGLQHKHTPFLEFIWKTHLESINCCSTPFLFPLSSTLNPFLTRFTPRCCALPLDECSQPGANQWRVREKCSFLSEAETRIPCGTSPAAFYFLQSCGPLQYELCPNQTGLDSRASCHFYPFSCLYTWATSNLLVYKGSLEILVKSCKGKQLKVYRRAIAFYPCRCFFIFSPPVTLTIFTHHHCTSSVSDGKLVRVGPFPCLRILSLLWQKLRQYVLSRLRIYNKTVWIVFQCQHLLCYILSHKELVALPISTLDFGWNSLFKIGFSHIFLLKSRAGG